MDLNDIRLDLDAAEAGAWFPFSEDASVKIAQWNNKAHSKFIRDLYARHGRKIEARAMKDVEAEELMRGQWVHIVKDWKGFTEAGTPLKFSEKTLLGLASNPQYQNFFNRIAEIARSEENFRMANVAEMGKLSPTP